MSYEEFVNKLNSAIMDSKVSKIHKYFLGNYISLDVLFFYVTIIFLALVISFFYSI